MPNQDFNNPFSDPNDSGQNDENAQQSGQNSNNTTNQNNSNQTPQNDVQTGAVVGDNQVSNSPGGENFVNVVDPNDPSTEKGFNKAKNSTGEKMPNGFVEEFWAILDQAGVSKRTFFIVLILVIIGIIFLVFWLTSLGDESPDSDSNNDQQVSENDESNDDSENSDQTEDLENENPQENDSDQLHPILELAILISTPDDSSFDSPLAERLALIQTMENFYFTDIYQLLDQSEDRTEVLNQHIERMKELINQANQTILALDEEMTDIETQFEVIFDERETLELNYFDSLENFDATNSETNFQNFVEKYKLEVELRATFNSKKYLRDALAEILEIFVPRYQDISLNKAAIVQGIKIIDVPSSNVDTILDFSDL